MSRTYSGTPEPRYVAMSESSKKLQAYVLELADFEANVPDGDDKTYLYRLQNVDKAEFEKIIESRCIGIYVYFEDDYDYLSAIIYLYANSVAFDDDNTVRHVFYLNANGTLSLHVQRDSQGCDIYLEAPSELGSMMKNQFTPVSPMSL